MKKFSYLLLIAIMLASCSSSDDIMGLDPQKGEELSLDKIVGTYESWVVRFDNSYTGFFKYDTELTFNADYTGEEWNPKTMVKTPFTWSYM